MTDLVAFLRARLDDDEQAASFFHWATADQSDVQPTWDIEHHPVDVALMLSPARVLAEVDAKRRILDEHPIYRNSANDPVCGTCGQDDQTGDLIGDWPCPTVQLLAMPYADHPDYREEWRPDPR